MNDTISIRAFGHPNLSRNDSIALAVARGLLWARSGNCFTHTFHHSHLPQVRIIHGSDVTRSVSEGEL